MWKPINPDHSIEVMAIAVTFVEPIGSVLFRRITRELETKTFAAGLTERQPIHGVEFTIGISPAEAVKQVVTNGIMFDKHSLIRGGDDVVTKKLVEQLQWTNTNIVYRAWKYSGWPALKAQALAIMSAAFAEVVNSVEIRSVRIEYRDRFYFDGPASQAKAAGVVEPGSDLLSPHIFTADDFWHSHTGKFEPIDGGGKKLLQVNVDCADLVTPEHLAGLRTVGILTAVELQYNVAGLVVEGDPVQYLDNAVQQIHTDVMALFKRIVDKNMLPQIGIHIK
ncbi:hypothetical protein NKH37_29065 [Mesorhizobium sp. M1217]|uniref:hypothetical protein n=1 Tax=Mesorhizobium sp. M1217 TaxID=2957070 RepID=UPI00333CC1C1